MHESAVRVWIPVYLNPQNTLIAINKAQCKWPILSKMQWSIILVPYLSSLIICLGHTEFFQSSNCTIITSISVYAPIFHSINELHRKLSVIKSEFFRQHNFHKICVSCGATLYVTATHAESTWNAPARYT